MPFQVGNTYGGKRENSGRPPKIKKEIEKAAAEIAREFINRSVKPVMATYFQLAHGRLVNKYHEGLIVGQEFEADAPTTRHFVDKLLPDEQQTQNPSNLTILIAQATIQRHNPEAGLRSDSLQILVSGDNGKNGNGSNGA
jgi:hypothetical protein